MSRVVFLHYHGFGHLNPCFPLASTLRGEGHEVFFAGAEYFKDYVRSRGFNFHPLKSVPFGMNFEKWVNTIGKKKHLYFSCLKDRLLDRIYHQRKGSLLKMIDDLQPDVILLDGTQATDFIVLYPHLVGIRLGIIHAMFPTHVIEGRPPVNSDAFPDDAVSVRAAVQHLKEAHRKKQRMQKMTYFGLDDSYITRRRLRKNKIPMHFRSTGLSLFNFQTRNISEFILAPREYDFPDFKVEPWQHYIGFSASDDTVQQTEEYVVARSRMELLQQTGAKIIYCSYGTVETEHLPVIIGFIDRLVRAVRQSGYGLIVSVKANAESLKGITPYEHLSLFETVPQIDVLSYCDVFVSHGGLSSIKESIEAAVPMLMYPVHRDFDPIGNAARIAYHGLGLRGDAAADTESDILGKLNQLLVNPSFKENIIKLKDRNSQYTKQHFLDAFHSLVDIKKE